MTTHTPVWSFEYRAIARFPMLAQFESVAAFEAHYRAYESACLDASHGGAGALRCLVGAALWAREVDYYYRQLRARLEGEARQWLETGQRAWETEKSAAVKLQRLIQPPSDAAGSLALLVESEAMVRLTERLNRARALLLRQWLEQLTARSTSEPPQRD